MTEIPFTQYHRPDGRPEKVLIDRPDEIFAKAQRIIAAGYRLEIEELATVPRTVSMTIFDPNMDEDVAIETCPNGPEVPGVVDKLIEGFDLPPTKPLNVMLTDPS